MHYDREQVKNKLVRWERYLLDNPLPLWEELPALELYMDQVLFLLNQYLGFLPQETDGEKVITPAMINNYVKMKIIPAPVKKRYTRVHLAYLIMVCTMKHSLNIAYVQKMIPVGLTEEQVREVYNNYTGVHKRMGQNFAAQVREGMSSSDDKPISDLVLESAAIANFSKLLTEKLIALQDADGAERDGKGEA